MKIDEATVTLFVCHTSEGLARACREHAVNWRQPCPVGWYFVCPLVHLGDGRCVKIRAEDWEAVTQTSGEDDE